MGTQTWPHSRKFLQIMTLHENKKTPTRCQTCKNVTHVKNFHRSPRLFIFSRLYIMLNNFQLPLCITLGTILSCLPVRHINLFSDTSYNRRYWERHRPRSDWSQYRHMHQADAERFEWLVGCIGFNATLTAKVISWRSWRTCVSWLSQTSTSTTFFPSNRLLFPHTSEVRGEIRRKESSYQPGIELTTTTSWVRHALH